MSTPTVPPPPPGMLPLGVTFAGCVIEGVAGRGGMGVVYRAREARPPRRVALKVIAPELTADTAFRERFEREVELAATIEHSNVLPVYRVGEEQGLLYLITRYVDGTDLAALIAATGRLEPRRAVEILAQVCEALDAAHSHGLVHRDVKPANVLIANEGGREHAYLTDFGITKRQDATAGPTRTGMFFGTLEYAAPEQFQGGQVDARTDVYATGCMLYESLAGRVPFPAETPAAQMFAHLSGPTPSVLAVDPTLPAELDPVIAKALEKAPDDRYLSAGDLGRAARAAVEGNTTTRAEHSVAAGLAATEAAPIGALPDAASPPAGAPTAPAPVRGTAGHVPEHVVMPDQPVVAGTVSVPGAAEDAPVVAPPVPADVAGEAPPVTPVSAPRRRRRRRPLLVAGAAIIAAGLALFFLVGQHGDPRSDSLYQALIRTPFLATAIPAGYQPHAPPPYSEYHDDLASGQLGRIGVEIEPSSNRETLPHSFIEYEVFSSAGSAARAYRAKCCPTNSFAPSGVAGTSRCYYVSDNRAFTRCWALVGRVVVGPDTSFLNLDPAGHGPFPSQGDSAPAGVEILNGALAHLRSVEQHAGS